MVIDKIVPITGKILLKLKNCIEKVSVKEQEMHNSESGKMTKVGTELYGASGAVLRNSHSCVGKVEGQS